MSQGGASSFPNGKTGSLPRAVPEDAVRGELDRILHSHEFRSSRRSQDFLKYIIENTLAGHSDVLKERTIGIDVFGRPASYDPSDDATVRVKAGEVRKRLGLYYAGEGRSNDVRIELPAGTYVPEFRWVEHQPSVVVTEEHAPAVVTGRAPEVKRPRRWLYAAGAALIVVAVAFGLYRGRPQPTLLDQFWAPVLNGTAPVLICAAYDPGVYRLDRPPGSTARPRVEDFVLLTDQFIGGGDLVAESRVAALLGRLGRPYRVKLGNDVSFQDLRRAPAILIGYSYTKWREISRELRYFIDAERRPLMVTDNGSPTKWALPNLGRDLKTNEDYAIITRVFHPDTQAMLVEIAGITQYGTEGAAELVTTPDAFAEALRGAPEGWQKKNLQLVVHVKVISGSAATPKVVGSHFF
jgi:hypothetical protein